MIPIIETERLRLRKWKKEDAQAYYHINQDPKVVELLSTPLTMEQVNIFIAKANTHQDKYGFTLWAVELKETDELIGCIGLQGVNFAAHFTPAVEIGWRLGSSYWNKGYATEGAKAALDYGFKQCGLDEIVCFTVPTNVRSIHLIEKIGFSRDEQGDFAHPNLPLEHVLSHHILYRLKAGAFAKKGR